MHRCIMFDKPNIWSSFGRGDITLCFQWLDSHCHLSTKLRSSPSFPTRTGQVIRTQAQLRMLTLVKSNKDLGVKRAWVWLIWDSVSTPLNGLYRNLSRIHVKFHDCETTFLPNPYSSDER